MSKYYYTKSFVDTISYSTNVQRPNGTRNPEPNTASVSRAGVNTSRVETHSNPGAARPNDKNCLVLHCENGQITAKKRENGGNFQVLTDNWDPNGKFTRKFGRQNDEIIICCATQNELKDLLDGNVKYIMQGNQKDGPPKGAKPIAIL